MDADGQTEGDDDDDDDADGRPRGTSATFSTTSSSVPSDATKLDWSFSPASVKCKIFSSPVCAFLSV